MEDCSQESQFRIRSTALFRHKNRYIQHLTIEAYPEHNTESSFVDRIVSTASFDSPVMRGTNNSMGALIDDHARTRSRFQKGDSLSRRISPSAQFNEMVSEEEQISVSRPCPPPREIARSHNRHRHAQRAFYILIHDIEATKGSHEHPSYKHRSPKASVNALEHLIYKYNLQHKNRAGAISRLSGEDLRKTFLTVWGKRRSEAARQSNKTPWTADRQDWSPDYLRMIEEACTELTLDESLPEYDAAFAEPFDPDANGHGDDKGSHSRGARTTEDEHHDGMTGAKVERDADIELEQTALDTIATSPMVLISPIARSPTPEPRKFYPRGILKVRLKTRLVTTRANTDCNSSERYRSQAKSVHMTALPMPLGPRHLTGSVPIKSAKLSCSAHTQAAAVAKSRKLLTQSSFCPTHSQVCHSNLICRPGRKRHPRSQAQRLLVPNSQHRPKKLKAS